MRTILLIAIRVYQRHVSPYKGFTCAYRAHTGRASCSAFGYRAVRRYGVWGGLALGDCGGCDWRGKRQSSEKEKYVYIPPDSRGGNPTGFADAPGHLRGEIHG